MLSPHSGSSRFAFTVVTLYAMGCRGRSETPVAALPAQAPPAEPADAGAENAEPNCASNRCRCRLYRGETEGIHVGFSFCCTEEEAVDAGALNCASLQSAACTQACKQLCIEKGYLEAHMGDPSPERGSRAKRYVGLTDPGREALRTSGVALRDLWSGYESLLEEGK